MPLTSDDRRLLRIADRLQIYLVVLAGGVLVLLLVRPSNGLEIPTIIVGIALCLLLWLTQRLLTLITVLDLELAKAIEAIKKTLPEESRRELFRS